MQIFEVKNDIAEILYEPQENNLFLSDFLFIEDNSLTIVSQVINISTTENEEVNIATVKFYLTVDKNNRLTRYNGHTPSKNAIVGFLDAKEIIELFKPEYNGILWGDYIRNSDIKVVTDLKFLSSGCAVIGDRVEQKYSAVKIITDSLKKNNTRFLLLDFDGRYKNIAAEHTAIYGQDYRIPLDSVALDYIFENDLNDCPLESKAYIQSIILTVQKYVETCEDGFIPFESFVNIVMSETENANNPGLLLFGNKLLKYKQKKIFADKKVHFASVNNSGSSFKLDVSHIDEKFYPLILKSVINVISKKFYVISDITAENATSSTLKYIYDKQNIRLIPVLEHDNALLNKVKSYCSNQVVYNPSGEQKTDERYSFLLEKLGNDEFILYGENTLFIPLTVSLKNAFRSAQDESCLTTNDDISVADLDDLDRINMAAVKKLMQSGESAQASDEASDEDSDDLTQNEEYSDIADEEPQEEKKNLIDNSAPEIKTVVQPQEKPVDNTASQRNVSPETTIRPENNQPEEIEDIRFEAEPDGGYERESSAEVSQNIVSQNVSDWEKETKPQETQVNTQNANISPQQSVEIKTVKSPSKEELQNTKKMPDPETLKVYEPKEPEQKTPENNFVEGDRVSHAKYGTGTVEKVINYGKKVLCSIVFDNVGRRLLDPNITVLEKM